MAESAVNFLLNHLSILIREERQLLGGLDQKVQYIKDQLELMQAFLRVADAKEEHDPQLRTWVRQVRELAYDAPDVLDLLMLRSAHIHVGGFLGPVKKVYSMIKSCRARRKVGFELGNIESRLRRIHEGHQAFQSKYGSAQQSSSSYVVNRWRGDALLMEEATLVGIEGLKLELIHQLLDGKAQLKAVSVVGMGGLGKTTLVKRIYEDEQVKGQFQCHAWICVSQSFDIDELFKNLIRQFYAERREAMPQNVEFLRICQEISL